MIIMRKYQQELPEGCSAERVFFSPSFLCWLVTPITFAQAICLLVWVRERRLICTNAPSRLCFVSKSAPVSIQIKSLHLPFLFYLAPIPLTITPTPPFPSSHSPHLVERGGESLGYYLMRSRSLRLPFSVTKLSGAPQQVRCICWNSSSSSSSSSVAYTPSTAFIATIFIDSLSVDKRCSFLDTYTPFPFTPSSSLTLDFTSPT